MNHVFSNHKMARLGRCAVTFVFLILFSTIHGDKCEGSDSFSEGENCRGTETNLITTYDMKTIQNETCLCVCCSPNKAKTRNVCKTEDGKETCEERCECSKGGGSGSSSGDKKCVSTAWLTKNNLMDGVLKSMGETTVLCPTHLPGLPCASPGHLLRVCSADNKNCRLKTYRELCEVEETSVCTSALMQVSRLRHSVSWRSAREELPDGTTVELTSMSHNGGKVDKFASRITDIAIRYNIGYIADWFQSAVIRIGDYEYPKCIKFWQPSNST